MSFGSGDGLQALPAPPIPRPATSRELSLARQRAFSDGSVSRWAFLVMIRGDIARQGALIARRRAGGQTVADRPTLLARLEQSKRRVGELLRDLQGGKMDEVMLPALDPAEVRALVRLVVQLYDLAEVGLREGADLTAEAAKDAKHPDWLTLGLGEGVSREAELIRTLIASDKEVWPLVRLRVNRALRRPDADTPTVGEVAS